MDKSYRHYEKVERIRQLRFGDVYKCHDTINDRIVALKWIPFRREKDVGLPCSEISVLKSLDHVNVVRLFGVDVSDEMDGLYLVSEYLDLDLEHFIGNHKMTDVDPLVIKRFLHQILEGVSYCHSQKVMHRDLKPCNVLVDLTSGKVKLDDFSCSTRFKFPFPEYTTGKVSALGYRAPEVMFGAPYSAAIDIWSVGAIFAYLVKKEPLFKGTYDIDIMKQIFSMFGMPDENDWSGQASLIHIITKMAKLPTKPTQSLADVVPGLEPQGIDLLSKMLCMNPSERITANEALRHPYFKNVRVNLEPLLV